MNDTHLQQIFTNYIKCFDKLNDPAHAEYYKWQVAKEFKTQMDKAFEETEEFFPAKLYEVKKLTENMIDSYTQPFNGLVEFSKREPVTVKEMFIDLFMEDGGDLRKRQKRICDFLKKSHSLRDKYYPDSFLYNDDFHSVTGYLFLYDPDHNYLFKATNALNFADCIEFYDDWGTGEDVKLDVYYRMCDQIADAIKSNKDLMETDAKRFSSCFGVSGETMHPDPEKHILVFDLIYCCLAYGLFDGISYERPKIKERQEILSRKEKAVELSQKLDEAKKNMHEMEEGKRKLAAVLKQGTVIRHKKFGDGIITHNNDNNITVQFSSAGEKQLGIVVASTNRIISTEDGELEKILEIYGDFLNKEDTIRNTVHYAEDALAPYAEYLE